MSIASSVLVTCLAHYLANKGVDFRTTQDFLWSSRSEAYDPVHTGGRTPFRGAVGLSFFTFGIAVVPALRF